MPPPPTPIITIRRRRRAALLWGTGTIIACTLLPIWTLRCGNPIEGYFEDSSLWWVLWNLAQPDTGPDSWRQIYGGAYVFGSDVTITVTAIAVFAGYRLPGRMG